VEKHVFDPNQPTGSMSLENVRNCFRALFQGDLFPLRPRASRVLEDFEYNTDALAQSIWAGTGVTVTHSTVKQEGNYALQAVIDITGERQLARAQVLNLSGFKQIKTWERCSAVSSAFKLFVRDVSGNESYWNLTSYATANTWKQDTITLATPDGNNGTPANLTNIISWGFQALDASATYIFDTITAICGLNVAVDSALVAGYYQNIYIGSMRLVYPGGSSPIITVPGANPRIDLLTINASGALEWTQGAEASSPNELTFPSGKFPICLVYCKPTMTKVVNFEDKDANPNEGYIYKDVRPLYLLGMSSFLALTDCPSSYSGQAGKHTRVKQDETGLEFLTDDSVKLTGDQTIAGVKTFSSFPVTPSSAPTTDYQVANKKFVDDQIATKASVAVLTGTISHGGTIPLPSGYTAGQCKWTVGAPYWSELPFNGDDNFIRGMNISVDANRVVTAQVYHDWDGGGKNNWVNISCHYIIIGVK
jgi:hypothetical protein